MLTDPRTRTASQTSVNVAYFSDLLCIWAYISQARVDELQRQFGSEVKMSYHFIPLFGDTEKRIATAWSARGGSAGFNKHVLDVAEGFKHIEVHPDIWLKNVPASSTSAHLVLKAVELVIMNGDGNSQLLCQMSWNFRQAFFRDCRDIGNRRVQLEIVEALGVSRSAVETVINDGRAYAALSRDLDARDRYRIDGSPTFVLNEGRQKLYGNLGYGVIEANVHELLKGTNTGQASWC